MTRLCWWCSRPTDAADPCPCAANKTTEFDLLKRHRAAVRRAREHDTARRVAKRWVA